MSFPGVAQTPDLILGIKDFLSANVNVSDLLGPNIWDFALPTNLSLEMPIKGVIIRPHGGPVDPAPVQLSYSRFQTVAFGETDHLAYAVYWTVRLALKNLNPSVWHGTYIHNVIEHSGPVSGRDPTLTWPYNITIYTAKCSDLVPPQ